MRAIFAATAFAIFFVLTGAALAQCGNDVTPRTKVALLQTAEALTKCSAFYHMLSTGSLGTNSPREFKLWDDASREAIISAAMHVTLAGAISDPTTKFNEYLQSFEKAAGGEGWGRGLLEECKTETARARQAMRDYVDGK